MVAALAQVAPDSEPSVQKVTSRNCRSSAMNTRRPVSAPASAPIASPPSSSMAIEVRPPFVAMR